MLKSENARLSGWVYVDMRGRDLRSAVRDMQRAVAQEVKLPAGYSISWSGQFEYLERATRQAEDRRAGDAGDHLRAALSHVPARRRSAADHGDAAVRAGRRLLAACTCSATTCRWRAAVGFIALAGVAAEFGVVMLLYLKQAMGRARRRRGTLDDERARRGDRRRRGAARAAEGDDRRRDHRRPAADHVGQRHRLGGHAAHRRADGRRHDHRAAAVDVRRACGVPGCCAVWPMRAREAHATAA